MPKTKTVAFSPVPAKEEGERDVIIFADDVEVTPIDIDVVIEVALNKAALPRIVDVDMVVVVFPAFRLKIFLIKDETAFFWVACIEV